MFYARNKELELINDVLNKPNRSLLVYGLRRVGKSTLINEALKSTSFRYISYECLKDSVSANVNMIVEQLYDKGILPVKLVFLNFIDLFKYLDSLNERLIIVLDEYPYLKYLSDSNVIDSQFQIIIDNYCKNINIIISGSHIGMMKSLLGEKNALYGRFYKIIQLKELNYLDSSLFYGHLSNYDKVSFYSVFGGSPFMLSLLDYSKSLKDNIKQAFLDSSSPIRIFIEEVFTSDLNAREASILILAKLSNGSKRYKELEQLLDIKTSGLLSKHLNNLIEMGFIYKDMPINKPDDNKKTKYHIINNALRFYYTYIYGKRNIIEIIGAEQFYINYIEPSIKTFISHCFERQCIDFLSLLAQNGKIAKIENIGRYYYDDKLNKLSGEFDIAIKADTSYTIFEVKYHKNKISNSIINKELEQIRKIDELNVVKTGFISINGFEDDVNLDYLYDGNDVYFKSKIGG